MRPLAYQHGAKVVIRENHNRGIVEEERLLNIHKAGRLLHKQEKKIIVTR